MMSVLMPMLPDVTSTVMAVSAQIARALQADLIALQIRKQPCPLPELARLYTLTAPIRSQGVTTRLRVRQGNAAERICREAAERRARWIVMDAGGDLKSPSPIAQEVLANAAVPVVLAHTSPTLRPGADLLFSNEQDVVKLLGRIRAAGTRWQRGAPNRVHADLSEQLLVPTG